MRPERGGHGRVAAAHRRGGGGQRSEEEAGAGLPQMKTGPVSPPAPSQVPAGAFRPRSVPNRVLQKQAPAGPDPGRSKQAPNRPFRLPRGKPRFRLADVFPANRRPSCERLSGKPATIRLGVHPASRRLSRDILPASRRLSLAALFPRANPASRPSVPLRANPSSPLWSPFEQALRAAFRGSFARRLRFRRTPGKWVRLWVSPPPRASSRLPRQRVPGLLPEGSRPGRRRWRRGSPCRCRPVFLDRERSRWRAEAIRAKPNPGFEPVDNVDNVDKWAESASVSPQPPAGASDRSPRHGRGGRIHRPRGPPPSPPATSARRSARARTPPSDNPRRAPLPG